MSDFAGKLSALCADELLDARSDPERMSEMVERLANSLALSVAVATAGEANAIGQLLEGTTSYIFEEAGRHAKLARFMARHKRPDTGGRSHEHG